MLRYCWKIWYSFHMKYGIIFDIDGTLWDATGTLVRGWNAVFEKLGAAKVTPEYVASFMGKTSTEIAQGVFPDMPIEQSLPIMKEAGTLGRQAIAEYGAKLFPGEKETLEKLHKEYVLCILTNSGPGYIDLLFNVTGFGNLFTDTVSHGENGLNKTENMKLLIERNSLDGAVYIGDTRDDQLYSQAAGIPFIFASYGHGQAQDPEYSVSSFEEIPDVIKSIFQ